MKIYFITGIDTNCGKTHAAGLFAKYLKSQELKVTTLKAIQTGSKTSISEDILTHRKIMGVEPDQFDIDLVTSPISLTYPCSPHLAASMENQKIYTSKITDSITYLSDFFDALIIEGAGGLFTPISMDYTLYDFLKENINFKTILVSSSKLGAINHTILTINQISNTKEIYFNGVIFNEFLHDDPIIADGNLEFLSNYFNNIHFTKVTHDTNIEYDFSKLI